jgi:zinc transporter, ZIP family
MSGEKVVLLGAIAGFTIFLGLPIGRLRGGRAWVKALLSAIAIGILIFLLIDIVAHAWDPIDEALTRHRLGTAVGDGAVLAAGLGLGLLGLVYFDQWAARRAGSRQDRPRRAEPGAAAASALTPGLRHSVEGRLALLIALGIGLHNFAEGLAIGNSAASGELSLAVLLVVGFGAHNATEGFGIVAPLPASGRRATWAELMLLGLIGGGPTVVGTLLGQSVVNGTLSVAFLALAAGSILYVVIELLAVARRAAVKTLTTWGIFAGLVLGFGTDAIITLAGV